ncbi:MAG TPA: NAD-dependent epimerase/dehydratase family protein [Acidimicrobiales bacterium]
MALHVILGKGAVGTATAETLVAAGHDVRVLSRSGGTSTDTVEHVALDATDAAALTAATQGAAALYNCANPEYHRWATDWPPIADALLVAAEATGAGLVTMGNLYGYGPVSAPMTEDTPLAATGTKGQVRIKMWTDALALHRAGRIRATEARASDFVGPGVTESSMFGERVMPRLLRGKSVSLIGALDQPHSWTSIPDVGRALAVLGTDDRSWGRAWHVPTAPPVSQRELVGRLCDAAGIDTVGVHHLPWPIIRAAGVAVPMLRELQETRHQFDGPFVIDSTQFTETFGIRPTSLGDTAIDTVDWWLERLDLPAPRVQEAA